MDLQRSVGEIVAVHNTKYTIKLYPKDHFSACKEKGCNLCSAPTKEQIITLNSNCSLPPETKVFITIPTINDGIAALITFGAPLLITMGVIVLLQIIPHVSLESGLSFFIITFSFFASLTVPVAYDRFMKKNHPIKIEKYDE